MEVNVYQGYFVGGYVFHTDSYGETRSTWNCGVNLKGNVEFYGVLNEVIELKYLGSNSVVLFNCVWRDSNHGIRKHPTFDMIDVKYSSRHQGDDVFILASQAQQVYMTPYPYRRSTGNGWWVVWKTKARSIIDIPYEFTSTTTVSSSLEGCYQEDEMPVPPNITSDDPILLDDSITNRSAEDVPPIDLPLPPPRPGQLPLVEAEYDSEDVVDASDYESDSDVNIDDLEFEMIAHENDENM